jgi:hypothetical protein
MATSHSQALSGLSAGSICHYRVKSVDAAGNPAISADYVFKTENPIDKNAVTISNVSISDIATTGAVITWKTNVPAHSEMEYGTTESYGSTATAMGFPKTSRSGRSADLSVRLNHRRSMVADDLVISHSVMLSGLTPGTTSHFRVKSRDASGNLAVSTDYAFETAATVDISSGLVAAYAFDEGEGSASEDLSGSGNTAFIHSAEWASGKYGKAISFNGIDSFVSTGARGLPAVNAPKTISCWVTISKRNASAKTILALANSSLETSLRYEHIGSQEGLIFSEKKWAILSKIPASKTWHHFGYIYDGTYSNLYIDGTLVGRSSIVLPDAPTTNFQIGRWINGSEYFEGSIDDLRVYARALNREELLEAMNTPLIEPDATDATETSAIPEEIDSTDSVAKESTGMPVVALRLERRDYHRGETIRTSAFWVSNPSMQTRNVELKTWLKLPGLQPISLEGLSFEKMLAPAFNNNYGTVSILDISDDAPDGEGSIGARLIDPVSGVALYEAIQSFTIGATKDSRSRIHSVDIGHSPIVMKTYMEELRPYYVIANKGESAIDLELKLWQEFPDGTLIQDLSIGSEGSLTLTANTSITLTSQHLLPGALLLRAKLMNAATGEALSELTIHN